MYTIPAELKRAVINDTLVVLTGAGLSYPLYNKMDIQLKGWKNFVDQMLLYLKSEHYAVDHLIPLTAHFSPVKVLDLIENTPEITRDVIYQFSSHYFKLDDEKNDYTIQKNICRLCNKIITTNYDTAFENAVPDLRTQTAYTGKNYELTRCANSKAKLLFKLHGCYESKDSMVLFPSDYRKLYEAPQDKNAERSLFALRNILYKNTLLIIGSGMGDFQINNIFEEIKKLQGDYSRQYFIITKDFDHRLASFLNPIIIGDFSEIDAFLCDLNKIKSDHITEEQQEAWQLQEQLTTAQKKIVNLQNKIDNATNASDKNEHLLQKAAWNALERGLEHQLSGEYKEAIDEYKDCLEFNPNMHEALNNWGNTLAAQARQKSGEVADNLFSLAYEKYSKALQIKPDMHEALNNWGNALADQAKLKSGEEADNLFALAYAKYSEALQIKPDMHDAFYNWGNALADQAKLKSGEEADNLFALAYAKYSEALQIKPDMHDAFYNWGNALADQAKLKSGEEADNLFALAYAKYSEALHIKPDRHEALHNWGSALVDQANQKSAK